jgi:hypothetical protein
MELKNCSAFENLTTRRLLLMARVTAVAGALAVALPLAARGERDTPPRVPADIQVEAGNRVFLEGHAVGTQNYICLPSGSAFAWTLFGPQATVFNDHDRQVITHFLSANPQEGGLLRATWQHSGDTSAVWAQAIASSSDPSFVAQGAIPWLLLRWVGDQDGPTGGDKLTATTFIQRLNTQGGVMPATGCALSTDAGKKAFVPYTADYIFYREAKRHQDDGN